MEITIQNIELGSNEQITVDTQVAAYTIRGQHIVITTHSTKPLPVVINGTRYDVMADGVHRSGQK
jgi:hypothetical protein